MILKKQKGNIQYRFYMYAWGIAIFNLNQLKCEFDQALFKTIVIWEIKALLSHYLILK